MPRTASGSGQSVGSIVSDLRARRARWHWVTGTSAPCTSVFKPVFVEDGLPDQGAVPGDVHDPATLWWRHEAFHRALLTDYPAAMAAIGPERDALEAAFVARMEPLIGAPGAARRKAVAQCWKEAAAAEAALDGAASPGARRCGGATSRAGAGMTRWPGRRCTCVPMAARVSEMSGMPPCGQGLRRPLDPAGA
jgi:hypothetical protein